MIISDKKEVKPGMVITGADFDDYYNNPVSINDFYLVLGLDSKYVNNNLKKLQEKLKSPFVTRNDLIKEMESIRISVIQLGSLYLNIDNIINKKALSDYDKASMQYLKASVLKILNNFEIKPMYSSISYVNKKFWVLDKLSIKEQDMNTWLLKKKLVDKDASSYVSLKDYTEAALKIISDKDDDFKLQETIFSRMSDMLNGKNLQKVKNFKPGELIMRITGKRARLLLVLGTTQHDMTYLLEIENGTHDTLKAPYYSHSYLGHILSAFRKTEKEVANTEYYDTGINVYDRFKDNITTEMQGYY